MDEKGECIVVTEKEVVVKSDAGVHARPAMMLVREAMKYSCSVKLVKDNIEADCKSIMSVLGLAIISGSRLIIKADGEGEEEIVEILCKLIRSDFITDN
jgi:phosphocarrier protein HPr